MDSKQLYKKKEVVCMKRKTQEEIQTEINIWSDNKIKILNNSYRSMKEDCNFKCDLGHTFTMKPQAIPAYLRKFKKDVYLCPICARQQMSEKNRKSEAELVKQINELHPNNEYEYIGGYTTNKEKIFLKHNIPECGKTFSVYPKNFLYNGATCTYCSGKYHKNTDDFKQEVYDLVKDEYTVLGEYTRNDEKIRFRHNCQKCNNNEFDMTPTNFLHGQQRCPACSHIIHQSKGEKRVEEYLKSRNYAYVKYYEFDGLEYFSEKANRTFNFPFDFLVYTESGFFVIEFDGRQHECGFNGNADNLAKNIENDTKKTKYCEENNIPLLRISYKDERRIEDIIDKYIEVNSFKVKFND